MFEVVPVRRIAREYNQGLPEVIQQAEEHNQKVMEEFRAAGVKSKFTKKALLSIPKRCPEDLDIRWVRRFMRAFNWKKSSRNTAGQYLDAWHHEHDIGVAASPGHRHINVETLARTCHRI